MDDRENRMKDLIIVGGGPAGLSAAIYGARSGMAVTVLDKNPAAGALGYAGQVNNYPGVIGPVSGPELLEIFRKQARSFGAEVVQEEAMSSELEGDVKTVRTYGGEYRAKAVIIASGAMRRDRTLPGEDEFLGKGVSYCTICDAPFFEGKTVAITGGIEEMIEELPELQKFAKKLYVITRGKKAAEKLTEDEKLKVFGDHKLKKIEGDLTVEKVTVSSGDEREELEVDGVFIFLPGNKPEVGFLGDQLELKEDGCVKIDREDLSTSVKGVYAAGDVTCKRFRQSTLAVGEGCTAALSAISEIRKKKKE